MALTKPLTSLITDGNGIALTSFLASTSEKWADEHLSLRYGQVRLSTDNQDHFASLCWEFLKQEYIALRAWFQPDGKLSPLLQSKFLNTKLSGPLGTGIGWDFKSDGTPEPRMLLFKGTLIAAQRAAELLPIEQRNSGSMQFGGLIKIVRSAYTARAEVHSWRAQTIIENGKEKIQYPGSEMSRRWIAHRSFTFLISVGAEPVWAWEASKCKTLFGPVDEERNAY